MKRFFSISMVFFALVFSTASNAATVINFEIRDFGPGFSGNNFFTALGMPTTTESVKGRFTVFPTAPAPGVSDFQFSATFQLFTPGLSGFVLQSATNPPSTGSGMSVNDQPDTSSFTDLFSFHMRSTSASSHSNNGQLFLAVTLAAPSSFLNSKDLPTVDQLNGMSVEAISLKFTEGNPAFANASDDFFFSGTSHDASATSITFTAVPVPAALPLLATALGGLGLLSWRRKRRTAA